jgi:hypothetical protein
MTITAHELRCYVYTYIDSARACPVPVRVQGGDYQYDGWLVGLSFKRSGVMRANVEDANGRLFIHNLNQLTLRDEP